MDRVVAVNVRLDRGKLLHLLDFGELCLLLIGVPMLDPHEEALVFIVHDAVDLPVEVCQPLQLHHVQFLNGNAANFGPRSVLKGVVIKELAAKKQTSCEHAVDSAR